MTGVAERETAAVAMRGDDWQARSERNSRRRARQARVATFLIFAAIIANLLIQLYARRI